MRSRQLILSVLLISYFLLSAGVVQAYSIPTHRRLTAAAANLFNLHLPKNKISKELISVLVTGSEREDDPPRFFYHFYDPVNQRGLAVGNRTWLNAKRWAQDDSAQLALSRRRLPINISQAAADANFTWQEALRFYQAGDKEKAYDILGHILHLIQDMAVPDHTRNDPHVDGSPYENFADNQEVKGLKNSPVVLADLDQYFDELANYSNANFYSKDTIGFNKYNQPAPDYFQLRDGYSYGVKDDERGSYFLMRKSGGSLLLANRSESTIDSPLILADYWDRLSPAAVRYSAGLLHLFLKAVSQINNELASADVGQASREQTVNSLPQDDKLAQQTKEILEIAQSLLARTDSSGKPAKSVFELAGQETKNLLAQSSLSLVSRSSLATPTAKNLVRKIDKSESGIRKIIEEEQPAKKFPKTEETKPASPVGEAATDSQPVVTVRRAVTASPASAELSPAPAGQEPASAPPAPVIQGRVVISELFFDAVGSDEGKEFIELYNLTDQAVDLVAWSIQTSSGKKNFEPGNKLNPQGFFLIWLGKTDSLLINPDLEWRSGSLKNTADKIYLVADQEKVSGDDDPDIVDLVSYDKSDFGDFATGTSLERKGKQGEHCLADQATSKFAGHGCDSGDAKNDFAVRPIPYPQNSSFRYVDFLKSLNFFKDPRPGGQPLLDIGFAQYPFVPGGKDGWKILVFYRDREAVPQDFLTTDSNWLPLDQSGLLTFTYPAFPGSITRKSLILPDEANGLGDGGGVMNAALDIRLLEDKLLRLQTSESAKFLSVAFYDFFSSGGGSQNFKLLGVSPIKYPFDDQPPAYQPPIINGDLVINFDKANSQLTVSWPAATDPDSQDNLIDYEVKIEKNGVQSGEISKSNQYQLRVAPADQAAIKVKARDEFANYSPEKTAGWDYPKPQLLIAQTKSDNWSGNIGSKNPNCPDCPGSASLQSVSFADNVTFDFVGVRLKLESGWIIYPRLGVYEDNGSNRPDFDKLIASKTINGLAGNGQEEDLTFNFGQSVALDKDKKYWLVLDVERYGNAKGFFESKIQNAIASSDDSYGGGAAGRGNSGNCPDYCSFTIPYPNEKTDWLFQLGSS